MIENIHVKSRKDMVSCIKELNKPSILISIRDVGAKMILDENQNLFHRLHLEFEDWDKEADGEIVISDIDATMIARFVKTWNDSPAEYDLYVNCEAGQSRSAGVAAAIAKYLFDDDEIFFRIKHPNMICYRKVLNALMEENEDD